MPWFNDHMLIIIAKIGDRINNVATHFRWFSSYELCLGFCVRDACDFFSGAYICANNNLNDVKKVFQKYIHKYFHTIYMMKIFSNVNIDTTKLTSFLVMNTRIRRRPCVAQRAFKCQDTTLWKTFTHIVYNFGLNL